MSYGSQPQAPAAPAPNKHPRTEADAVAEIVTSTNRHARVVDLAEKQVIVTIDERGTPKLVSTRELLAPYDTKPERRRGTAILEDLDSFVAHTNRFKGPTSALFASLGDGAPRLTAVLDYHQPGDDTFSGARFGQHRGLYKFPLSEEWRAWMAVAGKALTQQAFAEFLETRVIDVIDPKRAGESIADLAADLGISLTTPSRLLELSKGLQVRVNSKVAQAVSLSNGETQFSYATEHQDDKGAPLKIPNAFLIGIPVFDREDAYQLLVRLRYRVREGSVSWSLEPHNTSKALADAFEGACKEAQEQTILPLFFGSPE